MSDRQAKIADELAAKIHALLAGHSPEVQGAAIADLCAIWLSGHVLLGNRAEVKTATARMRRALFEAHCAAIWDLVDHYDQKRGGV